MSNETKSMKSEVGIGFAGMACLAGPIVACAYKSDQVLSFAVADVNYIDKTNVIAASLYAARKAVQELVDRDVVSRIVMEGLFSLDRINIPCKSLLGASPQSHPLVVLAKKKAEEYLVKHYILDYQTRFPGWGFEHHQGKPTDEHKAMIRQRKSGTPVHRTTFAPLSRYLFTQSRKVDHGIHKTCVKKRSPQNRQAMSRHNTP